MNIPKEAMEAAVEEYHRQHMHDRPANDEAKRYVVQRIIEAAAPLLMARAWDEALDDMAGCCVFLSDIEEHKAANPYHEPADD